MAGSVNKAILVGHLGRDPEVRRFESGGRICTMRLATEETWRDKATGDRKKRTEWHTVVITNDALIGVAEQFLKKGSKVYVEGQIETRKHTGNDNIERRYTEVVVRPYRGEIHLLDRSDTGNRGTPDDYDRADPPREAATGANRTAGQDMDDEIPF